MSDVLDLTTLSGAIMETARDIRLLRLQVDAQASRLAGHEGRFTSIDGRLGALEQSFHDLANETARGFGQMQQQLTRHEKRFDAIDAGLVTLGSEMAGRFDRLEALIVRPVTK